MPPQQMPIVTHSGSDSYDPEEDGDMPYQPPRRQCGISLISHDSTFLVDAFTGCDDDLAFLLGHLTVGDGAQEEDMADMADRAGWINSKKKQPRRRGHRSNTKKFLETVPAEPLSLAQRALAERRAQQAALQNGSNDNIVAAPASGVRSKFGPPSSTELESGMNWAAQ